MLRTICVPCQVEYRCEKNEVAVEQTASGEPYKLWSTDKWKCPGCGHEVIPAPRPSQKPMAEHFEGKYKNLRAAYPPEVILK